jgi:DNA-directed RNA polymerase subunit RPC12/RpoP
MTYGCYKCGTIGGEVQLYDEEYVCGECGDRSVVSLGAAINILHDLWRSGERIDVPEDPDMDTIFEGKY